MVVVVVVVVLKWSVANGSGSGTVVVTRAFSYWLQKYRCAEKANLAK